MEQIRQWSGCGILRVPTTGNWWYFTIDRGGQPGAFPREFLEPIGAGSGNSKFFEFYTSTCINCAQFQTSLR